MMKYSTPVKNTAVNLVASDAFLKPFDFLQRVDCGTLGFPRMGPNRELKFTLEKFWRNRISASELYATAAAIEEQNWSKQLESGVDRVCVGMFSLYDHVLDWIVYLGCEPERFAQFGASCSSFKEEAKTGRCLEKYFAMARGRENVPALDMTKWFDTNYHYEVPELNGNTRPSANFSKYLDTIGRALEIVGPNKTVPFILGPLTFLSLSKIDQETTSFSSLLEKLLPLYQELFKTLAEMGIREVQMHEPSLVTAKASELVGYLARVYGGGDATTTTIGALEDLGIEINLVTYFDEIHEQAYQWFCTSPVAAISLDFTRGDNLALLEKFGFPQGKRLGAGLIDGRSVWKFQPEQLLKKLESIRKVLSNCENNAVELTLQTSCSLQHVPYTTQNEKKMSQTQGALHDVLCFALEKLKELQFLKEIATQGEKAVLDELDQLKKVWQVHYEKTPAKLSVQTRLEAVTEADMKRPAAFEERRACQMQGLPLLPTTTIGSFPQTPHIRALRKSLKSQEISQKHYEMKINEQIAFNIGIQEGLGLDILVHGEPERSDMVEYFAEKLEGFAFTENGWVQSYGSRCVRPPIIYADLERPHPMTVREYEIAQSFTSKPVKGMLTGPVTILNWSFPRQDISRKEQAFQLALCLREEIADLERVACSIIQVDEPALREGMPLNPLKKAEYLKWGVDAFRLATAIAKKETSIHTHMYYCEFEDCMEAINALEADVNSIENARSSDATIRSFQKIGYKRDLGPGVYDIHSPVVPSLDQIEKKVQSFLQILPAKQIVVNAFR